MTLQDIEIRCSECGKDFFFTGSEQEFFKKKGLLNQPRRCPNCRLVSRHRRQGIAADALNRVNCARCNVETVISFIPQGYRPVFCIPCLIKQRLEDAPAESGCTDQLS